MKAATYARTSTDRLVPTVLALSAAAIVACAGAPRIQDYGPGRYTVSYSSIVSEAKSRSAAIRDANEYCASKRATMVPVEETVVTGDVYNFTLVFECSRVERAVRPR